MGFQTLAGISRVVAEQSSISTGVLLSLIPFAGAWWF